MNTRIEIDDNQFLINGRLTYEGREHNGRPVSGLLFNSRMVQGIFDDECPLTRRYWRYPDTDKWDPERNTDELCQALPEYRRHGLLAITVGMQGGGSIYTPKIYDCFENSAFADNGAFKSDYLSRLSRILKAADDCGMIVIVNYFYCKQVGRIHEDGVIKRITQRMTQWLLDSGYENILVDLVNESNPFWRRDIFEPERVHELIEIAQGITIDGRKLPVSVSTAGGDQISTGRWRELEDFSLPHGNGCMPDQLSAKLRALKETPEHQLKPRPIVVNEDSVFADNMDAAIAEYASWGFYCQGYGSDYQDRMDWKEHGREDAFDDLSGFQTIPVNWSINTPIKRRFFDHLLEVTGGL